MNALTFVETGDTFSTYRDRDGELVYLAHGVGIRRLTLFEDLDLPDSWRSYAESLGYNWHWQHLGQTVRDAWLDMLRETITDPEVVEHIVWCLDCATPMHEDDDDCIATGDSHLCDSCTANWSMCARCEEYARETTTTLDNDEVCESCRNDNYTWCDNCEGWYLDSEADEHTHEQDGDGIGCCESPAQTFTVRNDGEEPLRNDTRVTITLPAGTISQEGLAAIAQYLYAYAYDRVPYDDRTNFFQLANVDRLTSQLGANWQTREGNFTKRLSRYAYKSFALKLAPEVVSRVGCIARDHSTATDFHLEVTRNLNLSAAAFGHEDSCWWSGWGASRCALKSNGGFGMRTFCDIDADSYWTNVTGRAWVMPLARDPKQQEPARALRPTFNTHAEAFIVFNGYGNLSGYAPARLLAHMVGMTYRKVQFSSSPMYINSGYGYLVAREELATPYTDGRLTLALDVHSHLFDTEEFNTQEVESANVA